MLIEYIGKENKLSSLVIYSRYLKVSEKDKKVAEFAEFLKIDEKSVFVYDPYGNIESRFPLVRNLNNIVSSS
jgi:hypothetical protein